MTKAVTSPGPFIAGTTVQYEYVVTNVGPRVLHDVAVVDDRVAGVSCALATLAPGRSTACNGAYLITGRDVSLGRVTNIAQAAGVDSRGNTFVSLLATTTIPVGSIPVTG